MPEYERVALHEGLARVRGTSDGLVARSMGLDQLVAALRRDPTKECPPGANRTERRMFEKARKRAARS